MAVPQPRVIHRSDPARLAIEWADGARTDISAADLRRRCPCARCVDELTGVRTLDPASIPEDMTQGELKLVGNYAITVRFGDGHQTGLYTWNLLRKWAEDEG
ncbi:MAG: DUF971 domain-containing protein [Planctomycetota bacterium]|nr:DUF971 domain-containing protein [Planctomycetota bacterium]